MFLKFSSDRTLGKTSGTREKDGERMGGGGGGRGRRLTPGALPQAALIHLLVRLA